ncbi:TPA: glyoxalase [Candidatus Sumerlaeota bacterium]|nr:glyoxalase [Candidatus Sumerlaeota bacterium]
MRFVCPLIVVKDIAVSTRFYRDVLGQKVKFDFGENVSFEGDFAIHLETHYANLLKMAPSEIVHGAHAGELYFETNDIDDDYNRLVQEHVTFIHPVIEQPWKQRVCRFYDPDRHIIELGETMESVILRLERNGLSVEQIHEATLMPLEFIQSALR